MVDDGTDSSLRNFTMSLLMLGCHYPEVCMFEWILLNNGLLTGTTERLITLESVMFYLKMYVFGFTFDLRFLISFLSSRLFPEITLQSGMVVLIASFILSFA